MASQAEQTATKYKYELYWSENSGWHSSFGNKRLWENRTGFVVADLVEVNRVEQYQNHEKFDNMQDALDFMRTGKR